MSEIININFDFNNEQNDQPAEKPSIHLNPDSKFNNAPKETYCKVMKRFSMFDGLGHNLTECVDYDQALADAGLDYTGEKKSIYLGNGNIIPDNFAVVKATMKIRYLVLLETNIRPLVTERHLKLPEKS